MIEDLWIRGNQELEAWKTAPLPELIAHIVEHYHLGARMELARIETFAEAAVLADGGDDPERLELRDETARFCREFRAHMAMEERSLFPTILDLERRQAPAGPGELVHPLKKLLEDEHQAEVGLFQRLRDLAAAAAAAGAREHPARLAQALLAMEKSLYSHIFLENQVLFRRVD